MPPRKPEQLTSEQFRARYATPAASVGVAKARAPTKKKASPTNELTKAVVKMLTLGGCKAWRQNNGAVYDPTREVFRAGSATPGISDVLGYHRATGRFVAVEIKTGSDKLSPEQTSFLDEVRRAGGFACEGRSLDQIRAEFNAWAQALRS
ncbi:VRR-NUC domain-containing protein [Hymenobacter sp. M29]|uniref:VRR-NUC domain-containing protein n=1 Tax=Hymenobacter mellowenesis TaxID=3063995 RepID=A0ABT9A9F2_9BACT|nr:VRR-NUC domain-containing protein [Hymenobacter sp. M29]MDO7846466.1 VRR-NUC domain-containing protein [Hymenobacter sp. M29]